MGTARAYAFGPFLLDANRRTLCRDGVSVPLAPKPFTLLLLLVRHAGQTLSKERLLKDLWTDTVGTEANLSVNIATVRRALDEKPRDHRYIVTTPQRGYCFVAEVRRLTAPVATKPRAETDPASAEVSGPPRRLAVLPFRSSAAGTDDGLGAGFADAVAARLSSLQQWAIQSARTVRQHADASLDAVTIGRRLEADAVLEGEIHQNGDRVKVEARLINVEDGALVWGDTFTERKAELARLPELIGGGLAIALEPTCGGHRAAHTFTSDLPAFQEYLKGRFLLNRTDPGSVSASLGHFRKAQDLDPSFALAFAGSAEGTYDLWRLGMLPSDGAVPAIEKAARRAMELDPGLGEPYFWIAYLNMVHHWNWSVAATLFDLGIKRAPNSCLGRTLRSYFLLLAGNEEAALAEARLAQGLEPLNLLASASVANILRLTGRPDEALAQFETLLSMAPDYVWGRFLYGWTLLQVGRHEEAKTVFEQVRKRAGDIPYTFACLSYAHAAMGEPSRAGEYHDHLLRMAESKPTEPYVIAFSHLGLGDRDGAIGWLQKAYRERNPVLAYLRLEPCWAPLRDDPRVLDIISRIGAPGP